MNTLNLVRLIALKLALLGGGAMGWAFARHYIADRVRQMGQILLGKQDLRCIFSMLEVMQARQSAKRVYLSGPMSGLPELNYPTFNDKAAELRARGWHVENPAENPSPPCGSWRGYMRMALWQLVSCEAIYLLPGWENSKGARLEYSIAQSLGLEVIEAAISIRINSANKAAA